MTTNQNTSTQDIVNAHVKGICVFKNKFFFWTKKLELGNFRNQSDCYLVKVTEKNGDETFFTNNEDGINYYLFGWNILKGENLPTGGVQLIRHFPKIKKFD